VLAIPALGARASGGDEFVVQLTGTQQSVVVRAGSSAKDELGCRFARNDVDRQLLTFSASRRVRLALPPGAPLPRIALAARVAPSGSRHRQSQLVAGDADLCDPAQPPQTARCPARTLRGTVVVRPGAGGRIFLTGSLTGGGRRLACETTLTTPDRFLPKTESRLTIPGRTVTGVFAKGRVHATSRGPDGIAKTTDVRWTLVLRRVS
jgi:hypothetical protein